MPLMTGDWLIGFAMDELTVRLRAELRSFEPLTLYTLTEYVPGVRLVGTKNDRELPPEDTVLGAIDKSVPLDPN